MGWRMERRTSQAVVLKLLMRLRMERRLRRAEAQDRPWASVLLALVIRAAGRLERAKLGRRRIEGGSARAEQMT